MTSGQVGRAFSRDNPVFVITSGRLFGGFETAFLVAVEPEGSGPFQNENREWAKVPSGAPPMSYSHSVALPALLHVAHGYLASHFWGRPRVWWIEPIGDMYQKQPLTLFLALHDGGTLCQRVYPKFADRMIADRQRLHASPTRGVPLTRFLIGA